MFGFGDKAKEIALSGVKKYLESHRRELSEKIADAVINYLKNLSEEDLKKLHQSLVNQTEKNRDRMVDIIDKALEEAIKRINA